MSCIAKSTNLCYNLIRKKTGHRAKKGAACFVGWIIRVSPRPNHAFRKSLSHTPHMLKPPCCWCGNLDFRRVCGVIWGNGVVFLRKVRWISFPGSGAGVTPCVYEKGILFRWNEPRGKTYTFSKRYTLKQKTYLWQK